MDGVKYEPADLVIYLQGKGMVLREKALVAYEEATGKIVAHGAAAERLIGQSPGITVVSPLRRGRIADYRAAAALLARLLKAAWGKKMLLKPSVAVCVPRGLTEVERVAVQDAMYQARAKEVTLSEVSVEQFVRELPEKSPELYRRCSTIVGIVIENPERHIREELQEILQFAEENGISAERVAELLRSAGSER